jgi:hypothetical protein
MRKIKGETLNGILLIGILTFFGVQLIRQVRSRIEPPNRKGPTPPWNICDVKQVVGTAKRGH